MVTLENISPYIRYVNYYVPAVTYSENERILYDHEFMYVIDGAVDMFYGGEHYRLRKGDLFYLCPGVKNFISVDINDGFRTHCVHFDWTCGEAEYDFTAEEFYMGAVYDRERAERLALRPCVAPADFDVPHHMQGVGAEVGELFRKSYYAYINAALPSKLKLRALFMDIIAEIARLYSDGVPAIHPKTAAAVGYIQKNYAKPITVPQLAEMYGLSPKYFGTLFKNVTGKSVNKFIEETRIAAAREMLLGTDMTVSEIAEKAGFSSIYYFSRCFREHEKLTPVGFRGIRRK